MSFWRPHEIRRYHPDTIRSVIKSIGPDSIAEECRRMEQSARLDCNFCPKPAQFVLIVHHAVRWGDPDASRLGPGIAIGDGATRDRCPGIAPFVACGPCLRIAARGIRDDIARRIAALPPDKQLQCRCGLRVESIHNVLEIEVL